MRNRIAFGMLTACVVLLAGCGSDSASSADTTYIGHLKQYGVPTGVTKGANQELGHAVCKDLASGTVGGNEVISVTNDGGFTEPQAEVIVYWAITDLCPDQSGQRMDHWKDGS